MDKFPSQLQIPRPESNEASSFYFKYIDQIEGDNALDAMQRQYFMATNFYQKLPESKWAFRYEEGKWSIKQVLLHVIDTERVFNYRAMRIARGDTTPMPGFSENSYADHSRADDRSPISLIEEYKSVRMSTYSFFENLSPDVLNFHGIANDYSVSCRALAWILAGHEFHHLNVIQERYF